MMFKPWDINHSIVDDHHNVQEAYDKYRFPRSARHMVENWGELYKCQDAKDGERIRKKEQQRKKATRAYKEVQKSLENQLTEEEIGDVVTPMKASNLLNEEVRTTYSALEDSGWFTPGNVKPSAQSNIFSKILPFNFANLTI